METKKVGLCIVYKNYNYGAILQSYATLIELGKFHVDYEIINYSHPRNIKYYSSALISAMNSVTIYSKLRAVRKKIGYKLNNNYKRVQNARRAKFNEFSANNFKLVSKPIHDYDELRQYADRFTDVMVGSDQMWLPSGLSTNFYNLLFAHDHTNKISYASSFGVSKIPHNQENKTREYLSRIQHISVREESGARIVKELTGRDAKIILDPTMIITREDWDREIKDTAVVDGEYIFCYFLGNNPDQREEVVRLSKSKGIKIVALKHIDEYIPSDSTFGDIEPLEVGPEEFVNLIRHATYVCTDSFHASVFSIIYHKKFMAFNRFKEGKNSRNSRLDTLFNNIGMSRRFDGDIKKIDEQVDWESVDRNLEKLREFSSDFLVKALSINPLDAQFENTEITGHVICNDTDCTGCSACSTVCPKNAISMKMDNCGFWRPVINNDLCINCNSCNRVCPVNEAPQVSGPTKAFAYQNNDVVRFNSTSGGFFNAIATKILNEGGAVCGAAFKDRMRLEHTFVETVKQLDPLQRSKYVQSSLDGVFEKIKRYLDDGRKVLFVGMGCQAAALRKFIGYHDNLIIVDLVCYGVPSSGMFEDWIKYLEEKYGKVTDVRFRDKSYGYASPNVKVTFENGKYIESCRDSNMYTNMFFRHLSIRECCYSCHFKTVDRSSDITLGDLWIVGGINGVQDDNKGTTAVLSHTLKGEALCRDLCQTEILTEKVVKGDAKKLTECVAPANNAKPFWGKYCEDGFLRTIDLYEKDCMKSRLKYFIKGLMNSVGFSKYWYKTQKKKSLSIGQ